MRLHARQLAKCVPIDSKPNVEGVLVIPLTRGRTTIIDADDWDIVKGVCWASYKPHKPYAISNKGQLHRLIAGARDGEHVDHINGDPLDNRRCNLRICTPGQNNANRHSASSQLPQGVCRFKGGNRYGAKITVNGKTTRLGGFDTPHEAHEAYKAKHVELHGQFSAFHPRRMEVANVR